MRSTSTTNSATAVSFVCVCGYVAAVTHSLTTAVDAPALTATTVALATAAFLLLLL